MNCKKQTNGTKVTAKTNKQVSEKHLKKNKINKNHNFIESEDENNCGIEKDCYKNTKEFHDKHTITKSVEQFQNQKKVKTIEVTSKQIESLYKDPKFTIDLHKQSNKLNVSLRRQQDIAHILEVAEFIKKVKKNEYCLNNVADHQLEDIQDLMQEITKEDHIAEVLDNEIFETIYEIEQLEKELQGENELYQDKQDVERIAKIKNSGTSFLIQVDHGTSIRYHCYMENDENSSLNSEKKKFPIKKASDGITSDDIRPNLKKLSFSQEKNSMSKSDDELNQYFFQAIIETQEKPIEIYQLDH